ncbi:MAG: hypothetical protein ACK4OM_01960 [Alphaproteobacteria bacterium]
MGKDNIKVRNFINLITRVNIKDIPKVFTKKFKFFDEAIKKQIFNELIKNIEIGDKKIIENDKNALDYNKANDKVADYKKIKLNRRKFENFIHLLNAEDKKIIHNMIGDSKILSLATRNRFASIIDTVLKDKEQHFDYINSSPKKVQFIENIEEKVNYNRASTKSYVEQEAEILKLMVKFRNIIQKDKFVLRKLEEIEAVKNEFESQNKLTKETIDNIYNFVAKLENLQQKTQNKQIFYKLWESLKSYFTHILNQQDKVFKFDKCDSKIIEIAMKDFKIIIEKEHKIVSEQNQTKPTGPILKKKAQREI